MNTKLSRSFTKVAVSASIAVLSFLAAPAHAVNWTEVGDAGQLLGTAQEPTGNGSLRNIYGTISANDDVDLYKIFIADPTSFSASVTSTSGNLDSVLALFNGGGYGVYANDDAMLGNGNAGLPAGSVFGPQAQGWYYLAVFDDSVPVSAGGYIGSEISAPFTSVVSASGPGGASPLTGWEPGREGKTILDEDYRLRLSGVTVSPVPEPETYAMLLAGLGLVGAMARRRKVFSA